MGESSEIEVEPPDHQCERCGHPKPRLVFDQLSKLLLCERCLDTVQSQQAWSLLRETDGI
jgi:hypothetical protein